MQIKVAFDVYGTLIDTDGIITSLQPYTGDQSAEFSSMWRQKQLEYSFRRGLMKTYKPFSVCTIEALEYTCKRLDVSLDMDQKTKILEAYNALPVFEDVESGLSLMEKAGFGMYAFSNGTSDVVGRLLETRGISKFFSGIISTDEIKSFKPNPDVYHHFLNKSGAGDTAAWMVSGNPFDIIGAVSAGMKSAWVRRSPKKIFDPWGIEPTIIVSGLTKLPEEILGAV